MSTIAVRLLAVVGLVHVVLFLAGTFDLTNYYVYLGDHLPNCSANK